LLLVVEHEGRCLLVRRPEGSGFLAGSWLLPWADVSAGEAAAIDEAEQRYGVRFELLSGERGRTRHAITFREIAVMVARARLGGPFEGVAERGEAGWFNPEEIAALPTSTLVGKALAALARAEADSRGCRPGAARRARRRRG
jgi:hypothetical protein